MIQIIINILIGILILGILATIHELGHFFFAKLFKVQVNEMGLGAGPVLKKWERGETKYSIRLIPILAFVSLEEEENLKIPKWQNLLIVLGGPIFNIITAIVLFIIIGMAFGTTNTTVDYVDPKMPAAQSEFQVGDEIVAVNGVKVDNYLENATEFSKLNHEKENEIVVKRNQKEISLYVIPEKVDDGYLIGIGYGHDTLGVVASIKNGFTQVGSLAKLTLVGLKDSAANLSTAEVSGPVGIIGFLSGATMSIYFLLMFSALISLGIGIFNLLPIPALDGGRVVILLVEILLRRDLKVKTKEYINLVGFAFLMLLIILITIKDISNLIN